VITTGQVAVGTAVVAIGTACRNPSRIIIQNDDNTDTMYLGGSAVTTSTGLAVQKLERFDITLNPGEQVFAISTKSGHNLSFFQQRC
jgi:hypothetical protein